MRKALILLWAAVLLVGLAALISGGEEEAEAMAEAAAEAAPTEAGSYDVRATAIEACSCPLFCSCYYNPEPTGGHHCEFNLAYQFEDGSHWGGVDLSGARVWVSGDLGGHFGDGTTEWAVVTFDNDTTAEQREAINGWIGRVFPVEWDKGVEVREDDIEWAIHDDHAHAKMASGVAEVMLHRVFDPAGNQATVLNTPYWNTDSNEGFLLAHSTHHFDGTDHSYSYDRHNGFLITSRVSGELE